MCKSLSIKINMIIVAIFIVCCMVFVLFDYESKSAALEKNIYSQLNVMAYRMQASLQNPVWEFSKVGIQNIVRAEMKHRNVHSIIVKELPGDKIIAGQTRDSNWNLVDYKAIPRSHHALFKKSVSVFYDEKIIGTVTIFLTDIFLKEKLIDNIKHFIIKMLLLCLVEILILILFIRFAIIINIRRLIKDFQKIEHGDLNQEITVCCKDELGALAKGCDQLRVGIKNKINELNHEIEERKIIEMALRDSERRFHDLAKNSTDLIWEFDHNEIFTYVSPSIKKLLGYSPQEMVGQSAFSPMSSKEQEKVFKEFKSFKDQGEPFSSLINVNKHKDGSDIIVESSGVPVISNDGALLGYRGIDRDITERIELEDQLRQSHKMEAIGTLAGGIAHDFNNILVAILGYADIALEEVTKGSITETSINGIIEAGIRAKDLVQHILSFSRNSGHELIPTDVSLILSEALKLLRASMPSTIEIVENIDLEGVSALTDPTQLHQVIMNLCTNAFQAMEDSGGVLELTLDCIDLSREDLKNDFSIDAGKFVRLIVKDTGPGIKQGYIKRIFDPYFTTKGVGKGSGMGLAVVHGIVNSLSGKITVTSSEKGSVFTVFLPQVKEENMSSKKENRRDAICELPVGSETILLVDDEDIVLTVTKGILERLGYKVVAESDSVKALELFKSNPDDFNVVITDQTMPKITGDQLAKELRNIKSEVPIILCTGHSVKVDQDSANELDIDAFMMKPIIKEDLAKTIRKLLDMEIV